MSPHPILTLFDLDGTLVDSLGFTFEAFNYGITSQGGEAKSPEEIMKYFGPWELSIFASLVGEERAKAACDAYEMYVHENIEHIQTFPEIEDLFHFLEENKIQSGIVTGRSLTTTKMILEHHLKSAAKWAQWVVPVICNDHVKNPKPAPDGIELALDHFNAHHKKHTDELFYIGDSTADVKAAKAAGATAIACLWDSRACKDRLANHQPQHLVQSPKEIITILQSML